MNNVLDFREDCSDVGPCGTIAEQQQRAKDEHFMRAALEIAAKGAGWVNPNPQVGCVIVKNDRIMAEGWHTAFGKLHAEREALADCRRRKADPAGATAYVTLEPCCHYGKTPPCTEALIEAGIARVVVGAPDPNPLVAGKGVAQLQAAGIKVTEGVLECECQDLNKEWLYYIQNKRPYVTAKWAQTADGSMGLQPGKTCWLTGEPARCRTHKDRARMAAIMVGVGTVLADDPQLTCRLEGNIKQPLRIVVDSRLRIPLECQLVQTAKAVPTLVVACEDAPQEKVEVLRACGVEVMLLPQATTPAAADATSLDAQPHGEKPQVNLPALLDILGARGIDSLIVEGGPTLLASFFKKGLVNGVQIYMAPKLFGAGAACSLGALGVESPDRAPDFAITRVEKLGEDLLIEGEVR